MDAGDRFGLWSGCVFAALSLSFTAGAQELLRYAPPRPPAIVKADIVALDQMLVYNRFGSFNPFGMMFALRRDVVARDSEVLASSAEACSRRLGTEGAAEVFSNSELAGNDAAGNLRLRDCKRPRPLVLRANVGDVLELRIGNMLLSHGTPGPYGAGPDDGKPGLSGTFCSGKEPGKRYGNRPAGVSNDEDEIWRGTDAMCRSEAQGRFPPGPASRPSDPPHLVPAGTLPIGPAARDIDTDWPSTRHISFVINGLRAVAADGQTQPHPACTGLGAIEPGKIVTCRWHLDRDGTHFISSQAAPAGGEGDGGSLTHGLFAALIVEPAGSQSYRSQVTKAAFDKVWPRNANVSNPHARMSDLIETNRRSSAGADDRTQGYEATDDGSLDGVPVLNMLKRESGGTPAALPAGHELAALAPLYEQRPVYRMVHSDLNAVVNECVGFDAASGTCASRSAFREFTAILHDELKTFYTDNYQELSLFGAGQLAGVRDGFAINYGASGMGTMMLANRKRIGPGADCTECLYEEFFLQSWVNGDPALLEHYPDDPSNVHHSYLNDRVVFRNFHAGPKETHVFHLHAHQWFAGNDRNRGGYLDSQTVGPQQGFTYRIYSGGYDQYSRDPDKPEGFWQTLGAGNRNRTPGDSIFHCHLYPHFAQGMWALWRNHEVLEDGSRLLPDGQDRPGLSLTSRSASEAELASGIIPRRLRIREGTPTGAPVATGDSSYPPRTVPGGTPIPGLIPLPDDSVAPPPLPTYGADGMPGYPFYIPGEAGRRAPQAPLDLARDLEHPQQVLDGGLPRHTVEAGIRTFAAALPGSGTGDEPAPENKTLSVPTMLASAGATMARSLALGDFSAHLDKLALRLLPLDGTPLERRAMSFHHDGALVSVLKPTGTDAKVSEPSGVRYQTAGSQSFAVNGAPPKPGAPFADPCAVPDRTKGQHVYRDSEGRFIQAMLERELKQVRDPLVDGHPTALSFVGDPGLIGFRRYEVSAINVWLVVNRAGWHDPQARINALSTKAHELKLSEAAPRRRHADLEPFFFRAVSGECIEFRHTNELPKDLEKDDFQVKTPTDTIGQHIHLVKFDVMSADGSANGWNYEDGTFAPDEVLARICAARAAGASVDGGADGLRLEGRSCEWLKKEGGRPVHKIVRDASTKRWFQTTVQRWFADPILSTTGRRELLDRDGNPIPATAGAEPEMRDRTLRTVFTHDHFGPSSIQQHGFYSALVIEPQRSLICQERFEPAAKEELPQDKNCARHRKEEDGKSLLVGDERMVGAHRLVIADQKREERETGELKLSAELRYAAAVAGAPVGPAGDAQRKDPKAERKRALEAITDGNSLAHLNTREYLLAIADFAILYDSHADPAETQIADAPGQGLLCLLREARRRLVMTAAMNDKQIMELHKACEGGADVANVRELLRSHDMPPAWHATLRTHDVDKLEAEVKHLRGAYGKPIAPPRRPESISVDHHDPYLVNYKNEPLALRVGTTSADGGRLVGLRRCLDAASAERVETDRSVRFQRKGEEGDMANVFLTLKPKASDLSREILHGDPCTPPLNAYAGERVQMRLIQGAQEVQHAFTLEGYTFSRNIDQRLPSKSILPPQFSPGLAAMPTRFGECFEADRGVPMPRRVDSFMGGDSEEKILLRAHCDNVDGRVAAQEVGISEHFEFGAAFTSEGTNAELNRLYKNDQLLQADPGRELAQLQRELASSIGSSEAERQVGEAQQRLSPQVLRSIEALVQRNLSAVPRAAGPLSSNLTEVLPQGLPPVERLARMKAISETAERIIGLRIAATRILSTDSLYHFGTQDALWNGAWGLLRVFENAKAVDHPTCIERTLFPTAPEHLATTVYLPNDCTDEVGARLTSLRGARAMLRSSADSPSDQLIEPPATTEVDITISCPTKRPPYALEIRAEARPSKLYRLPSPQLSDPDALRFVLTSDPRPPHRPSNVPDPDGPLVLRVNAGDCFTLTVRNALPAIIEQDGSVRGPDRAGDARMPPIVPLNTDLGGWDKFGRYDAHMNGSGGVLRPSSRLAVLLPLSTTRNRSAAPAPFGLNETGAMASSESSTMSYYAGTMVSDWRPLEDALRAPVATGIAECAGIEVSFEPNYAPGQAVPAEARAVDILGRTYRGSYTDEQKPAVEVCLQEMVQRYKQPMPYAFGALPLKSYGDVIGHVAHGLAGTLIVEPDKTTIIASDWTSPSATVSLALKDTPITRETLGGDREMLPRRVDLIASLQPRTQSEHVLLWQDGLNLHTRGRRSTLARFAMDPKLANRLTRTQPETVQPQPIPDLLDADAVVAMHSWLVSPAELAQLNAFWTNASQPPSERLLSFVLRSTPLADCMVCNDSYDWGKRGVNYRSGKLTARLELAGPNGDPRVDGLFDLNGVPLPADLFAPTPTYGALHLPVLASRRGDDVAMRIVHPGGRARQRAFVLTGAGYSDLFPGFGFPDAALLMPGKALTAHWLRRAESGCQLWRDGPNYMVGQGVWGLHGVIEEAITDEGASRLAEKVCRDAASVR